MFGPSTALGWEHSRNASIIGVNILFDQGILILGCITFSTKQILDGNEDFLASVLPKLCPQKELKMVKYKKQKIRIFCCEGHLGSGCAVMSKYFFRDQHWGASVGRAELGCCGTVRNKNSRNESNEKGSGDVTWPHCHHLFIEYLTGLV